MTVGDWIVTAALLLSALVLTFAVLPVVILWFGSVVMSDAPFVPVPKRAVSGIVEALELQDDSVVYDMGCGDGRILFACKEKMPGIRAVGIEKALLPFLLSSIRRKPGVAIIRGDFFETDFSNATHVVMYLFPEVMQKVLAKLEKELKPGTKVLTIDFSFQEKVPERVIHQDLPGLKRGTELSVYIF